MNKLEPLLQAVSLPRPEADEFGCTRDRPCGRAEWCALSGDGLKELGEARVPMTYRRGENIFHQGEESQGVYCIGKGAVLLRRFDGHGNETTFRLSGPGETIGWRSYFADESHQATALVLEDMRVCFIPGQTVDRLIERYPVLGRQFLVTLARDSGPKIALLTRNPYLSVLTRLANFLWLLAGVSSEKQGGKALRIDLPMKRSQIAGMLATRGETLSRAIAEMRELNIAEFDGRTVVIHDLSKLEDLVRS